MIDLPGVEQVWAALPEARIAGGAIRDCLLGVPVYDVDFASPLTPQAVIQRLQQAGIKSVPTGLAHGTVTAVIGGQDFEITTLRRDVETDGRHATVEFTDDWRQDAARRDFTINAMSMTQDGTVFDYFDGQADLRAGKLRFVGDAALRIAEDYLRILRFFRFFARYAKGSADAAAIDAITKLRDGVGQLSAERVWREVKRILQAADPRAAIALMQQTGVLKMVFRQDANIAALNRLIEIGAPADALLRVAALAPGDAQAFAGRLKPSNEEAELLRAYRQPAGLEPGANDADLRRALADELREILLARLWLAQDEKPGWDQLRSRIAATPSPVFPLQGRDIVALGVAAGPQIGEVLAAVRGWWRQNGCKHDFDACLAEALRVLQNG